MTQNDNFKYYYGQSLINKDTISEYESIMDYIVGHGGSGSGIDADMLDGHDINDFLLLEDNDSYMPPGFYIGYTPIENQPQAGLQFLYSRDIRFEGEYLYMFEDEDSLDNTLKIETFYQELLGEDAQTAFLNAKYRLDYKGDWDYDHSDKVLNAGLCDLELAINCLLEYENKNKNELSDRITELSESTPTAEQYAQIKYLIDNYLVDFRVYDADGNLTNSTEKVLDAGAVNGLRFFLVTQQQYDQYPDPIKNDPRYVFIIRDSVPEDYVTPTTISAGSFRILLNTEGTDIKVSSNGGATYYDAGSLYKFDEDDIGLLPMYVDDETLTLPTLLADPLKLGDNFFINGLWMRNFLGGDPNTTDTLDNIIEQQMAGLKSQVESLQTQLNNLDNSYEVKVNKLTDSLVDDTNKYPSSHVVMASIVELQEQITTLQNQIGQIDSALHSILGTGTD